MKCLVMMPFASPFDAVFGAAKVGVSNAISDRQIECYWLKDHLHAGRITDELVNGIQHSSFCLADLTGNNPNVMWETGYAMALGKPTILVGQSVESIPFDLKVHRILPYTTAKLEEFSQRLAESVRQTLARYSVAASTVPAVTPQGNSSFSIAVTGSACGDIARTSRRIETMLQPYLALNATWFCGSSGTTDELALSYLRSAGKHPISVGYDNLDYSAKVRAMIEGKEIKFLDASVENLPRGLEGPSARDIYFATKADLVVLFWDGESRGTAMLLDYFKANGKNLVIGFI